MNIPVYEKNIIRTSKSRIGVTVNWLKEIKRYIKEGSFDLAWFIVESAVPEQIPYCEQCAKEGRIGIKKDGRCAYHKKGTIKYAFKKLTREEIATNLNFVKHFDWFISLACDSSLRKFDEKKILKGIVDINKNNAKLCIDNIIKKYDKI